MKAIIRKRANPELIGKKLYIKEIIHDRIVVLITPPDDRKVDFGVSEVKIIPDFSFGYYISNHFRFEHESVLRETDRESIARRAAFALKQKISDCRKAINMYVWDI